MAVKTLAWVLTLTASVAVFTLYVRPEFMVAVANQVWGCF